MSVVAGATALFQSSLLLSLVSNDFPSPSQDTIALDKDGQPIIADEL